MAEMKHNKINVLNHCTSSIFIFAYSHFSSTTIRRQILYLVSGYCLLYATSEPMQHILKSLFNPNQITKKTQQIIQIITKIQNFDSDPIIHEANIV